MQIKQSCNKGNNKFGFSIRVDEFKYPEQYSYFYRLEDSNIIVVDH